MLRVESAGITDVGRRRKGNEDSLFVDDSMQLYIVADGMGGHKAGEVASNLVVETMRDYMKRFLADDQAEELADSEVEFSKAANRLNSSIHLANTVVFQLSQSKSAYRGMGSTVSAVHIDADMIIVANVGDSPIYLIRNEEVRTISVTHTVIAEQAALAPAGGRVLGDEFKHVLTRAMGTRQTVMADISEIEHFHDDRIVISSDGLSDLVTPEEVSIVAASMGPAEACQKLVDMANERGGTDNITVIVLRLENEGKMAAPEEPAAADDPDRTLTEPVASEDPDRTLTEIGGHLPVEYDTDDGSYTGMIEDLTVAGGFIATTDAFFVGQEVSVTFMIGPEPMIMEATVVKREARGIRVRFHDLTKEQQQLILAFTVRD